MPDYSKMTPDQLMAEAQATLAGSGTQAPPQAAQPDYSKMTPDQLMQEAQATLGNQQGSAISQIPADASMNPMGMLFPGTQWEQPGQPEAGGNPIEAVGQAIGGHSGAYGETVGQLVGGAPGAAISMMPIPGAKIAGPLIETAGATVGGVVGAAGDYYLNPVTGESLAEHLQNAAGRSALASVGGQVLGKAVGRVAKTFFGEGKAATIPAVKSRFESFKDVGMTSATPSMVLGEEGGGWRAGLQEAAMGSNFLGSNFKHESLQELTQQGKAAIQTVLDKQFPGISNDYAALGVGLEAQYTAMKEGTRLAVSDKFKAPALELARAQGINAANVIFDRMGNVKDTKLLVGETTNIQDAIASLRRTSSTDSGFNRAGRSVPDSVTTDPKAAILAQIPGGGQGLPPTALNQIFQQMGLDPDAQKLSYDQLRHLMTQNLALSHTATDPSVKIAANQIGNAARQDLYAMMANNTPARAALEAAHTFYENEFLDVFVKSSEAQIFEKKDYSRIAESFINESTTPDSLIRIQKLVGPRGANEVAKASQQKMINDAVVRGTEDQFSFDKYLSSVGRYDPKVLQSIYGSNYGKWKEVVDRLRDANTQYKAALNSSGTAGQMGTYSGMLGAGKLVALSALGLFSSYHPSPIPIVSAAIGLAMPFTLAKYYFKPSMLPYWIEGMKWSPTMKNAGAVANRLATRISSTLAVEAANDQGEPIQIQSPKRVEPNGVKIVR